MSALVTGGAGFIGRHVVSELLQRGQPVRVFDDLSRAHPDSLDEFKSNSDFLGLVPADVTDVAVVDREAARAEIIYHLAANVDVGASVREPAEAVRANLLGTLSVADAARRRGLRLVLISTCHVYASAEEPLSECAPTVPASPYAASKLAGEIIARSYARTYGLRLTIIRPFNVYGPWQHADAEGGVVAQFLRRDLVGKPLQVHGDGAQTRDFLFMEDCARGIVAGAAESAVGEVINLATGTETSIATLAHLIAIDVDRVQHVGHPHPDAEVIRYVGDSARARDLIGWEATIGLASGLARTRAWLAGHEPS